MARGRPPRIRVSRTPYCSAHCCSAGGTRPRPPAP